MLHVHTQTINKCIKLQAIIMNPSNWIKAATFVTQQKQEATMAEMD